MLKPLFKSLAPAPAKIAMSYISFSLIYLYFSDSALRLFDIDVKTLLLLQSVKGTAFVLVTGTLLFLMVRHYSNTVILYYNNLWAERKSSFDDLKKSEEKYWTVFNYSPLPMWIFDTQSLRFLLVNDAACRKYGYTKEEFYIMRIDDIRPEDEKRRVADALKEAVKNKHKVWDKPYTHLRKNGDRLTVNIESVEIPFEGKTARLVIATDVTKKIKDDQLLQEANQRVENACNIAKLGYWTNDLLSSQIYWSDTLFDIFEQDKNTFELTFENIMDLFHEDHKYNFDPYSDFGVSGLVESERRIISGTGREKWILERISVVKDATGRAVFLEGIAFDITERKQARHDLQMSNERFNMVARAAIEAIIDWNILTGDIFWGDGFRDLFGYEPPAEDSTLWIRNIHPADKMRVTRNLAKALANSHTEYFFDEFRFLKADGQIAFVEHRSVFVRDANGRATRAVGAMIDVTQHNEKMLKIAQQNAQLKEIAWMQSHLVRAPLANLMGLTTLLQELEECNESTQQYIEGIIDSANKLDSVVKRIVSRSEQLDYTEDPVL